MSNIVDQNIEIFKKIMEAPNEPIDFKDAIRVLGMVTTTLQPSAVKGFLDANKDLTEHERDTVMNLAHSILISYAITLYNCLGHEKEVKEMLAGMKNVVKMSADTPKEELQKKLDEAHKASMDESIKEMN